jgi:hypothetical protein
LAVLIAVESVNTIASTADLFEEYLGIGLGEKMSLRCIEMATKKGFLLDVCVKIHYS